MKQRILLITLTIPALVACAATSSTRIDDALLSELPKASMANVIEARSKKDTHEDAYAKARRDTRWAEEQVELSRAALKTARAEVDESKLTVALAEKSGTTMRLGEAKAVNAYKMGRTDMLRSELALHKRELEHARLNEKLALEELRLSRAQVELQKARELQQLDRLAAKEIPLKDYEKQARFHQAECELARVRLKAAAIELEEARKEHEAIRVELRSLEKALPRESA